MEAMCRARRNHRVVAAVVRSKIVIAPRPTSVATAGAAPDMRQECGGYSVSALGSGSITNQQSKNR